MPTSSWLVCLVDCSACADRQLPAAKEEESKSKGVESFLESIDYKEDN